MFWGWGGHMGAGGWIGMGFMIVFWIAIVIGVIYLVRHLTASAGTSRWQQGPPYWQQSELGGKTSELDGSTALRVLEERYARGEIDREEFLERKADLAS